MKRIGLGLVFTALSVASAIAGVVLYIVNSTGSYYDDFRVLNVVVPLIGIVLAICPTIAAYTIGEKQWTDVFYVLSSVVLAVAAVWFVAARVESAGIILGSRLEAGNQLAKDSLVQAFVGIGCFIASMLFVGVSGFFLQRKQKPVAA